MELKAFEEDIDFKLLYAMKNLIIQVAERSSNAIFSFIPLFEFDIPIIKENFDFSYPGEVLERFEEKYGCENCGNNEIRALALALVEEKNILDSTMFIGDQYDKFISKIRRLSKTDLYLAGTLYHLTKKKEEKENLFKSIASYSFKNTKEIIFALYILQEEEKSWDILCERLNYYLGKQRTILVYENLYIFAWIIKRYAIKLKNYKKRGLELLKALFELPYSYIKEGKPAWKRLQDYGYSAQEILYANLRIPNIVKVGKILDMDSITMERMAIDFCKEILNGSKAENFCLYELCKNLLKNYQRFKIKIEGKIGIKETLDYNIKIKDKFSFLILYELQKENLKIPENSLIINIGEEIEWDNIAKETKLKPYEYRKIFEKSLIYMYYNSPNFSIDKFINKYKLSTGTKYQDIFWNNSDNDVSTIFSFLLLEKKYNLMQLIEQYAKDKKNLNETDVKKRWCNMKTHIYRKIHKLSTYEDYLFCQKFISLYSIKELNSFFELKEGNFFLKALSNIKYLYQRKTFEVNIIRKFLKKEEQEILIDQFIDDIFTNETENYCDYLVALLMNEEVKVIFPKKCKDLLCILENYIQSKSEIDTLREKYYTQQEWEEYLSRKKEKKEREEKKKEEERKNEIIKTFEQVIIKSEDDIKTIEEILRLLESYRYSNKLYIGVQYLIQQLKNSKKKLPKKVIYKITDIIFSGYKWRELEWDTVKNIIINMEELNE